MNDSTPKRGWLASRIPLEGLQRRLTIPSHRHTIWRAFGWLTLFLLVVMIASGILLSVYYTPSASPATTVDGSPIVAAVVLRPMTWNDHAYEAGEVIAVPFNELSKRALVPASVREAIAVMNDSTTGKPIRPSAAWTSVEQTINREADLGCLMRSVHRYSSEMLVAALLIHLFSALFMHAYKRPRELTWLTGIALLLVVLGFAFTGYLLPWNRLAYAATRIGVGYVEEAIPWIGVLIAEVMRGGEDIGPQTLTRLYSAHTIVLPMMLLCFTAMHVILVHLHGLKQREASRSGIISIAAPGVIALITLIAVAVMASAFDPTSPLVIIPMMMIAVVVAYLASAPVLKGNDFYSRGIYRELLAWTLLGGIIVTLAITAPWRPQGESSLPVDLTAPITTPRGAHPEWYFMFAYQLLTVMPGALAMAVLLAFAVVLSLMPFIDRSDANKRFSLSNVFGAILLVSFLLLTMWGYATAQRESQRTTKTEQRG